MAVILLVERETDQIKSQLDNFQLFLPGATILTANSSQKGIALAAQADPEVIILGELHQSDDRIEFCYQLKRDKHLWDIPIIFLTYNKKAKEARMKALDAGVETLLSYPVDNIELVAQVKAMIKIKSANQLLRKKQNNTTHDNIGNKRAEIDLQKSRNLFQRLVENLPQRIFIKDLNSVYISCNEIYARDLGITPDQIIGKDDYAFHPIELANAYRRDDQEVTTSGMPKIIEEQYVSKGQKYWIHMTKTPYRDNNGQIIGLLGIFEDITVRKQTEEEIKQSEFKYRYIYDNAIEGMYRTSIDGKAIMANTSLANMLGYTSVDEYLNEMNDSLHQVWFNAEERSNYIGILEKQGIIKGYECRLKRKDGTPIWVLVNAKLERDKNGQKIYSEGFITDITDSKLAEIKLLKANRLYNVISQINQAIVHIKDKDQLLDKVCQIAIEFGKFQMAWIGMVDPATQLVKPHSIAGLEDGYLTAITQIKASNTPEGRGPTGRCIREGKYAVCNDFANDPDLTIWRDEALKRNYLSAIGLPIKQQGKTIGSFTLYATIPYFFDDQEIQLLTEVSDDISFALDTIELEQKHNQTVTALAKSEEQFRGIFNNLQDAYFQVNTSGTFTLVSPSALRIYGYQSLQEMIGMPAGDLYANISDRDILISELAAKGSVADFICLGKRKDGSTFWVSMNVRIQYDTNGEFSGTEGVVRDISARMIAEEEVKQAKQRFQTMFEQAPVGITLSNSLNDEHIEINSKFAEILGRTKDEIKILGWKSITHPDDLQEDMEQMAKMNAGETKGYQMKKRYIRPDGSAVWVYMTIAKINDEDHQYPQNLCMIEDITDRINNEDKIRILSRAIEQSPVSIVITDTKGNIEYVNPKFTQTTGYSREEAIGANPRILKSETKSSNDYIQLWETINSGNDWHGEFLNVKKNGEPFYESASISPVFDDNGKITHFIAVKEDITDKKKNEEQIKTLSTVVEQSPLMISITDRKGNIEFVNAKFINFMQYSQEEILGTIPWIFNPKNNTPDSFNLMWKTLHSGQVWQTEFKNRKKDKTSFWEHVAIFPLLDNAGSISNYIIQKDDITEKKQLLDDLVAAKNRAEESDHLKSAFLANMSHEIRTPLNSIIGFADLLLDPFFDPEQQTIFVQMIKTSGNNLLAIISDIVDISKIESGQITLHNAPFSIEKLIHEIAYEQSRLVHDKGLEIKVNLPEADMYMDGDEGRVKQILMNYVNNAIKFTEAGVVEIGCTVFDSVQFYVKDTGIGIPKEFHEKVFERFRQVETAHTRKYGGNGLGLAIARQLAELMGAWVWMESEPGKGSTFFLSFPATALLNK